MPKHEEKYCPKCYEIFVCKEGDIANCQCNGIVLTESAQQFLAKTSFDCLCIKCLQKLSKDLALSKSYIFPTQKEMFVKGLHYYIENNNWVFTEMYHMLRGYCCESGCRHCVYGFKKN